MIKHTPQHFDVSPQAPQPIKQAVQQGKVTPKQAYEAGYAEVRCNPLQKQFTSSPLYTAKMEPLMLNLDMVLANSGVDISALCQSATAVCSGAEIATLQQWHQSQKGVIYFGEVQHVYKRMEAMAAALIRNFIDARIYTVNDMVECFIEGTLEGQVLVVPDFFTPVCENKSHDPFLRNKTNAYSFLIKLKQMGKRAIIYTHDVGLFTERHGGQLLHDLLRDQFNPIEV